MNTNIKEIDVTLLLERIEKERINKLKACKKYYEKNKERLQEYRRNLYEEQKDDPEYKQRLKESQKKYYQKKKEDIRVTNRWKSVCKKAEEDFKEK